MRKGKFGIALFSAVILLAIVAMAIHTIPETAAENPVALQAGSETLEVWTEDGTDYYAFLPGFAPQEQVVILPLQEGVALDGQPLPRELPEGEESHALSWQENGQLRQGTLHLLPSEGVATLFLDTQSGSMDYIHAEKGNAERGSLRLYDEAGSLNYSGNLRSVRGRGNSTWVVHEKKPYSLKLVDKADLLGMGAATDWILLADALDSSGLRNKTVLDFAARAGLPYTPEARWTEVYLNGEYAGLYLLCERIEVNPERVNLTPDGSLISMDRDTRVEGDAAPYMVTKSGQYLQIRDSADIGALKEDIQAMETALLSEDGDWLAHIDLDSWVKKYLVEEIFASYDAGFQSQYFFCRETGEDSKIFAGPVWDFDSSMGNPGVWALNSPRGLFAWRPQAMVGYDTPWFNSLCGKPEFQEKLKEEYTSQFLPLLETLLEETIPAYARQFSPAFERNRIRWKVDTPGLPGEAEAIVTYMEQRIDFLTDLWVGGAGFCVVRLQENSRGGYYAYYAVAPGSRFEDLPERSGTDFLGWYREDTDTLFDPDTPVTEDLNLYPKYPGETSAAEESGDEKSLMDLLLRIYHYVPGAVLLLMGAIFLPIGIWKSRTGEKKQPSKTH